MKDSVTKFDFDDAFKALDEIEIPKATKGIKANREDLHETMKRVDKFKLLFEDFYDVNDSEDMNAASEEREAEVAKAKLARIEKIVDLDAETEDDILPSYVGKTIIQCPQCMMLFYKDAEDISRDEANPNLVNIGEVCQHCGNDSGYDVIGKVAEETEEVPADDFTEEETTTEETGDGENDLSVEGETTSEEGEVDELSAEADLDELDLDLEEEPAEEEEEVKEESLNTSELLKKIEDKNELKTENESENLTLNEDIEDNLDNALKDHEEYIEYLRTMISQEEEALSKATNEQVKKAIQKRIDAFREDLEAALPDAVKAEAQEEELPDAEEAGMEDATDNAAEEEKVEETTEPAQESIHNSETQEKAEEQSDLKTENESKNLTLNEAAGNNISDADFNELLSSNEFKKPISSEEVKGYYEGLDKEEPTETDVKALTEITDIDDESFNETLTESLKEVYQNVKSFTMTNCSFNESKLIIEGIIAFNSGKEKATQYIFESVQELTNVSLTGTNSDLFESGEINITANIINETLQAKTLTYKYSIGEHLVEGLIRK